MSSAGLISSLAVAVETSERAVEDLELALADLVTRQQHLASQSKSRSSQLDSSICSVSATVEDIEGILALVEAAWRHVQESLSHKLRMLLKEAKTCERIAGDAGDPTVYNGLVRTIDELTRTKKMVEKELKVRNSELHNLKRHVETLKESDRTRAARPPAEANQEWQTLQLKLTKAEQENLELSRLLVDFDSEQVLAASSCSSEPKPAAGDERSSRAAGGHLQELLAVPPRLPFTRQLLHARRHAGEVVRPAQVHRLC